MYDHNGLCVTAELPDVFEAKLVFLTFALSGECLECIYEQYLPFLI